MEHGYDIAVQMDGDGQHVPHFLGAIVAPVAAGEADVCIGSRFLMKDGFQTSFMRRLGIQFLSVWIRLLCGVKVYDTTSGFRACSAALCAFYAEHYAQDYPEPEAIISAVMAGFRIGEAPVMMRERTGGKSSINTLRAVYYMIKVTIAITLSRLTTKKERRKK